MTEIQQFADQAAARLDYDNAQYAEAAQALEHVIDRLSAHDREPWTWLLWLAACYRQMGADGAARRCYKEVASAPDATKEDRAQAQEALADLGPES